MLTDKELAQQLYQRPGKLRDKFQLGLTEEMGKQVRHLAAIDHRGLRDQLRHLVQVGIAAEFERLRHDEEAAPAIWAEVERQNREAERKALAKIRKRDAA